MKTRYVTLLLSSLLLVLWGCRWNDEVRPDDSPWGYGQPVDSGFDESLLLSLDSLFKTGRLGGVNSMLVLKENELVFENYYNFKTRDSLQAIGSMGNVLVSLLVGVAIDQGYVDSVQDSVYKYLSGYEALFESDPLKKGIRFSDILTMKSGLSWNETLTGLNSPANDLNVIRNAPDRVAYLLEKPLEALPGQRFSQNSSASLIVLKALEQAFDKPASEILNETLLQPLGIHKWVAAEDDTGLANISFGMAMRPIDLMKIGYLALGEGQWEGRQLVPAEWITESTTTRHRISSFLDIGYLWWRFSEDSSWQSFFPENRTYYALSDDNQYLFVLPEYDMVYLLTSERSTSSSNIGYYVLSNYMLPFVQPISGN